MSRYWFTFYDDEEPFLTPEHEGKGSHLIEVPDELYARYAELMPQWGAVVEELLAVFASECKKAEGGSP